MSARRLLAALSAAVFAGFLAPAAAPALGGPVLAPCAEAATESHAAVVLEHGTQGGYAVRTFCIAFGGSSINADTLLRATGLSVTYGYNGQAICAVDGEPNPPPSNCLGGGSDPYWEVFDTAQGTTDCAGNGWLFSANKGITGFDVPNGGALGLRYARCGAPPSPAGVCPQAAAQPQQQPPPGVAPGGAGTTSGKAPAAAPAPGTTASASAATATAAVAGASAPASAAPHVIARTNPPPAPSSPAGASLPLLLAAVAIGVLVGLMVLRLVVSRRPAP